MNSRVKLLAKKEIQEISKRLYYVIECSGSSCDEAKRLQLALANAQEALRQASKK